jgi:hypothetical protein
MISRHHHHHHHHHHINLFIQCEFYEIKINNLLSFFCLAIEFRAYLNGNRLHTFIKPVKTRFSSLFIFNNRNDLSKIDLL